jgi:L-ascorbate metabolism protein UlaG (beta-lactamase superfamily)
MKMGRLAVLGLCWAVAGCSLLAAKDSIRMANPAPDPIPADRPALKPGELGVTWLGVAGALIRGRTQTVAFDPYVTRRFAPRAFFGNPRPDEDAVDKYIPKVDMVLIGHSHLDHLLDAPYIAKRDQAQLIGTLTTANIARANGVPSRLIHVMGGGDSLELGGLWTTSRCRSSGPRRMAFVIGWRAVRCARANMSWVARCSIA